MFYCQLSYYDRVKCDNLQTKGDNSKAICNILDSVTGAEINFLTRYVFSYNYRHLKNFRSSRLLHRSAKVAIDTILSNTTHTHAIQKVKSETNIKHSTDVSPAFVGMDPCHVIYTLVELSTNTPQPTTVLIA